MSKEFNAWFTVDELNAWAEKKLKENPHWAEQPAQQEPVALRNAVFTVLEGFTLPHDVRRILETAYYTPAQRKPLTHEQRFDLLTKFEPHKNKWEAPAILIDMVEAAHDIKENT